MLGFLLFLLCAATLVVLAMTIAIVRHVKYPLRRSGAYAARRGLAFDPGDLELRYESWTLDRPGAALPVWEIDFELDPDESPRWSVVFIHDWRESRIDALTLISYWRGWTQHAVLYDLRGHGESSPGPARLGCGEVDDLLALLAHLDEERRILLAGHGLGANLALTAAARSGESGGRIGGVIAVDSYSDFHARLRTVLREKEHPHRPMTKLAMWWFRMTGCRPLLVDEADIARLEVPTLLLDEWNDEKVDAFLQRIVEDGSTSTPDPSGSECSAARRV